MSDGIIARALVSLGSLAKRWIPSRRRPLGILIFVILYIVSGAPIRMAEGLRQDQEAVQAFLTKQTAWTSFCVGASLWPQLLELLWWIFATWLICRFASLFIRDVMSAPNALDPLPAFLGQICGHIGLHTIFPVQPGHSVTDQLYAGPIRAAVACSKKVRMLSIAGYEWLGKGTDSLLYDTFANNQRIQLEFILLDPDDGTATLQKRVNDLLPRDAHITVARIRGETADTVTAIRRLNENREVPVQVYYCKWHPVFRLVICDDELFVSAYVRKAHGHESPVCRISRLPPNRSDSDTWYAAYSTLFDSIRDNSRRVF